MTYSGEKRPIVNISVGGAIVKALLDTGSAVSICNSQLLKTLGPKSRRVPNKHLDLRAANGECLRVRDHRLADITLNNRITPIEMIFVDNLQVPCILGMDYLQKAGVMIDAGERKLLFKSTNTRSDKQSNFYVSSEADITIQPLEEFKVSFSTPANFHGKGLISAHPQLRSELELMEGIIDSNGLNKCAAIVLNVSQQAIHIPKSTPLALIETCNEEQCKPLNQIFSVQNNRTTLSDVSHLKNIDLSHVPSTFQAQYKSLLCQYADIFSKHDLDVGHSKTLPHHVRLTDPNKVVSVNQYRLPYHLKEVAIDYVDKLLRSGVIRPSTSVFNSPLMLVKKPNSDPKKPLAEQYRLVHNYVELNKSIAPCSYPLRHLYELLDEVAGGKIFSVLDLSQGFFQQTLVDPLETTSFSIPGYGQFTYNRSPQGLNSSPAYFQRLLDYVLKTFPDATCI